MASSWPTAFEFLLRLDLFTLCHFLDFGIDLRALRFIQLQLCKSAFVVDRHSGTIFDSPLNIVDADIVAEYGTSVRVSSARWAYR